MILRNVETLGAPGIHDVVIPGGDYTLDLKGALAFPGLINSHDHLEFNCYEQLGAGRYQDYVEWGKAIHDHYAKQISEVESIPRALRIRIGIVKNLLCGVTAVAHHGSNPECDSSPVQVIAGTRSVHSPRLGRLSAMLIPGGSAVVVHVGEGVGPEAEREIDDFLRWNIWRKRLIAVHGIAMRPDQARRFSAVVWCPVSNEFLFGATAPIAPLKDKTVILLGTDSTLTAPWNIWDHIRRARELGALTDNELIAALTANAERVWNLPARTDIVVARKKGEDPLKAFFDINPEDILLVSRGGAVVLVDGSLRGHAGIDEKLFPVTVNGTEKFIVEDFPTLAAALRSYLPSIPLPFR